MQGILSVRFRPFLSKISLESTSLQAYLGFWLCFWVWVWLSNNWWLKKINLCKKVLELWKKFSRFMIVDKKCSKLLIVHSSSSNKNQCNCSKLLLKTLDGSFFFISYSWTNFILIDRQVVLKKGWWEKKSNLIHTWQGARYFTFEKLIENLWSVCT